MESADKAKAIQCFNQYDKNKSKFIELIELKSLMKDTAKEIGISPAEDHEIEEILKRYDINHDNKISSDEFLDIFQIVYEMKQNI